MKLAAAFIILALCGCAMLASHQRKPFPLLIDEAEAVTIVCNPVLVTGTRREKIVRT